MSRMVLSTMRIMMKYSNGVETTTLQILYLKLSISFGMYRSNGRAWIAKSMQDFWKRERAPFHILPKVEMFQKSRCLKLFLSLLSISCTQAHLRPFRRGRKASFIAISSPTLVNDRVKHPENEAIFPSEITLDWTTDRPSQDVRSFILSPFLAPNFERGKNRLWWWEKMCCYRPPFSCHFYFFSTQTVLFPKKREIQRLHTRYLLQSLLGARKKERSCEEQRRDAGVSHKTRDDSKSLQVQFTLS